MYTLKTCRINDRIEVEKYYSGRQGAPGMPRKKKHKATPEEMARHNHWKRCRYLRRVMELNFDGGDYHLTLTCREKERPSMEDAPKVIRAFRDRVAAEYKKREWVFKYIITCETGKRGAVHWHMVTNNMQDGSGSTWDIIRRLWKKGRIKVVPLDDNREYGKLAEYIVKKTTERINEGKTEEKLSYMASRNLKKPVERKKKVNARRWKKEPGAPKGYRVDRNSIVNGKNKFTGLPYQKYTLVRDPVEKRKVKRRKGGGRGGT